MTDVTSKKPAPTGRSVLRAGAHAAWAVTIASAAPAFAACSGAASAASPASTNVTGKSGTINATTTVTGGAVKSVSYTLTFASGLLQSGPGNSGSTVTASSGWSVGAINFATNTVVVMKTSPTADLTGAQNVTISYSKLAAASGTITLSVATGC